jgi:uncharacterized protein YjiS (DUF1127 family)
VVAAWLARALLWLRRGLARARERQALARLSDRELRDIGVTRYEARHEANKPWWRD